MEHLLGRAVQFSQGSVLFFSRCKKIHKMKLSQMEDRPAKSVSVMITTVYEMPRAHV